MRAYGVSYKSLQVPTGRPIQKNMSEASRASKLEVSPSRPLALIMAGVGMLNHEPHRTLPTVPYGLPLTYMSRLFPRHLPHVSDDKCHVMSRYLPKTLSHQETCRVTCRDICLHLPSALDIVSRCGESDVITTEVAQTKCRTGLIHRTHSLIQ